MSPVDVFRARHLLLPFNRPEYYSVPEALVSALCWRAYEELSSPDPSSDSLQSANQVPRGYMYHAASAKYSTVEVLATRPQGLAAEELGAALKTRHGFVTDANPQLLGETVATSILGARIDRTGNQPASPMTPGLALLQDMRGATVKGGPPDYGEILEAMFTVGHETLPGVSATELILRAMDYRLKKDPFLAAIDAAVMESVLPLELVRKGDLQNDGRAEGWCGVYEDTPFVWFAETWQTLTSREWVKALPARVWVDWATTVLRLVVGLGFLWEYSWYEALGSAVARNKIPDTIPELLETVGTPLPWPSSRSATSVRDVGAKIRSKLARGDVALQYLKRHIDTKEAKTSNSAMGAIDFLRQIATETHGLDKELLAAKRPPQGLWETVRYGLQTRDSNGPHTDYFGILRTRGNRYLIVDPGTEWIAVIASLTCKVPNGTTNVAAVLRNLTRMGLRPEVGDLINLLERAGLARGSADADQAVVVQSAF